MAENGPTERRTAPSVGPDPSSYRTRPYAVLVPEPSRISGIGRQFCLVIYSFYVFSALFRHRKRQIDTTRPFLKENVAKVLLFGAEMFAFTQVGIFNLLYFSSFSNSSRAAAKLGHLGFGGRDSNMLLLFFFMVLDIYEEN